MLVQFIPNYNLDNLFDYMIKMEEIDIEDMKKILKNATEEDKLIAYFIHDGVFRIYIENVILLTKKNLNYDEYRIEVFSPISKIILDINKITANQYLKISENKTDKQKIFKYTENQISNRIIYIYFTYFERFFR